MVMITTEFSMFQRDSALQCKKYVKNISSNCIFATLKKNLQQITTNRPEDHHNNKYTR